MDHEITPSQEVSNPIISVEDVANHEKLSLQKELDEYCSMLGIEEVILDVDFSQPPLRILDQLTSEEEFGLPLPHNFELPTSSQDENVAIRQIYKVLTYQALQTYVERFYLSRNINQSFSVAEFLDERREKIDNLLAKAGVNQIVSSADKSESINRHEDITSREDKRAISEEQLRILSDLVLEMSKLDLNLKDYATNPVPSMLRGTKSEEVLDNCVAFSAAFTSACMSLGIPDRNIRSFIADFHVGNLMENNNGRIYFFDPIDDKSSYTSHKIHQKNLPIAYNTDFSTQEYMGSYVLRKHQTKLLYKELFSDLDAFPFMNTEGGLYDKEVRFMSADEGIATGLLLNCAYVAFKEGKIEEARKYFNRARLFDPDSPFIDQYLKKLDM